MTANRLRFAAQLLFAGFLGWLYGGDLLRFARAQGAPVTVMNELPSLPLSLVGVAVALTFGSTLVLKGRRGPGWGPWKAAVLAAVGLIFFDFVVLSSRRSLGSAEGALVEAVFTVSGALNDRATTAQVPRDARGLEALLGRLGPVPLFVEGTRVARWQVASRGTCAGPSAEVAGAAPGTLLYCTAADGRRGWVTLVATAGAQTFGEPAVVSVAELWVGEVSLAAEPPSADEPTWGSDDVDEDGP